MARERDWAGEADGVRPPDGDREGSRGTRTGYGGATREPAADRPAPAAERPPSAVPPGSDVERPAAEDRRVAPDRRVIHEPVEEDRREAERREADRRSLERRQHVVGRIAQGVDYVFYLLYGLLGIRFVLALLGAAETAGFARFINGVTEPFYAPFSGIVARPSVNGGFLDFPLIIAVLAYALLHLAVRGLLGLVAGSRRVP